MSIYRWMEKENVCRAGRECEPGSPALQADSLPSELPGKPIHTCTVGYFAIQKKLLPFEKMWTNLKSIMQSKISWLKKDKYLMISLKCEIWKRTQKQCRIMDIRVWGRRVKMGRCWSKDTNFQRWISSEDLMYSVMTVVKSAVLYS